MRLESITKENEKLFSSPFDSDAIPTRVLIQLLRTMVLVRRFEEKIVDVYGLQDMKTPVHLCLGEEAISVGVCAHLQKEDYLFTTHRSHGHCLAKGMPPRSLYAEFYGRVTGCCRGKGGSMHPAAPEYGILGTSAIVGGCIPLGVGTALASKLRKDEKVSVVFFGDGASEQGVFHESLNFASLKKLPVIFVCENNLYATSSYLLARQPHTDIFRKAEGHDIPSRSVDGNNVISVYSAAKEAIERARSGMGPTLLECKTYRWKGHVGPECDHEKGCRPKEDLFEWMEKCPLKTYKKYLIERDIIDEKWYDRLVTETEISLDKDLKSAKESPFPEKEELLKHVYFEKKEF